MKGVSIKLAFSLLFALCFFATGMNAQGFGWAQCKDSDKLPYKAKSIKESYPTKVVVTFSIPTGGFRCDDKEVIVYAESYVTKFSLCDKVLRYDDTTLVIQHIFRKVVFPRLSTIYIKNINSSTLGCVVFGFNTGLGSAYEAGRDLLATGHSQV